jgi:uncharacterized RDD family membrane protein YckC
LFKKYSAAKIHDSKETRDLLLTDPLKISILAIWMMNRIFAPASIMLRGIAIMADFLLLSFHFFPVTRIVKGTWLMTRADHHWWGGIFDPICLAFLIIIVLYFILFEGLLAITPGKALCGLRIIKLDGSKAGMKESLLRFAGRMIDGIGANLCGVIVMLCNRDRRRVGDFWADTLVVKTNLRR